MVKRKILIINSKPANRSGVIWIYVLAKLQIRQSEFIGRQMLYFSMNTEMVKVKKVCTILRKLCFVVAQNEKKSHHYRNFLLIVLCHMLCYDMVTILSTTFIIPLFIPHILYHIPAENSTSTVAFYSFMKWDSTFVAPTVTFCWKMKKKA